MRTVAVLSLAGVVLLHVLPDLPSPLVWITAVAALGSFYHARAARVLLVVVVAFGWAWLHADAQLRERLPATPIKTAAVLDVKIVSLPVQTEVRQRFVAEVTGPGAHAGRRVRLSWYEPTHVVRAGERWRLAVRMTAPRGLANPHTPDYEGRWFRDGIDALGYVLADPQPVRLDEPALSLVHWREWLSDRIAATLGARPATAIVQALVVGDRRGLTPASWETLIRTGTGHLIAISGLHIGLVAGAVFAAMRWVCRRTALRYRPGTPARCAAVAAILAALVYALLAGFTVPTRRALIMVAVALAAVARQRAIPVSHGLALAAVGVIAAVPADVLSAGFWLSFGAVAVLATRSGRSGSGAIPRFAHAQWHVTLGLAPISAAAFARVSLLSPLANAVFVPLYSMAIVPLALLGALVVAVFGAGANPALDLAAWLIERSWAWIDWLASLSFASTPATGRPTWIRIAAMAGAAALLAPRWLGWRAAGIALWLPMLCFRPSVPPHGGFELSMLDTGQGLSVVVETTSHLLLFDAGPRYRSGGDAGRSVVVPFVDAVRPRGPDLLVLSHDDLDHTGGADAVMSRFAGADVMVGGELRRHFRRASHCVAGREWRWDAVHFEVLHPAQGQQQSDNDGSCVIAVSAGGTSVLITGDIERGAEHDLLARRARLGAKVVIAPHHGSNTSSTPGFVHATGAAYALFAVGHGNRWDFPRPAVVARWQQAGAVVIDSADAGAIRFTVSPAGAVSRMSRHRCEARRLWTLDACATP